MRWPAEWEDHEATWLAWPHNADTWGERLPAVEAVFAEMVEHLCAVESVRILTGDSQTQARAERALGARGLSPGREAVELVPVPTDDAWIRDTGPLFVERDGAAQAVGFRFDSWGGKYPPWERDAAVGEEVAGRAGAPFRMVDSVLEGGSIDGDGAGTVLTTEECLLHPNRGPGRATPRSRDELEGVLADALGASRVVWLGRGIAGDDTDGHVDDITRFVAPGVVVTCVEPDSGDANHRPLRENRDRLRDARDAAGRSLSVVELPMPEPLVVGGERLPASHANFYLANELALVPVFGGPSDECALRTLSQILEGRRVVGIPARDLVIGFGAVHCLTQQQPRSAPTSAP